MRGFHRLRSKLTTSRKMGYKALHSNPSQGRDFRSRCAPASLKPRDALTLTTRRDRFPEQKCSGLIEARNKGVFQCLPS